MPDDGFRIATAYVAIEPSDAGFRAQLDAKVKEAVEGTAAKVRLDTDATGLAEKVRADAAAVDAEAHVKVKVDDSGADLRTGLERLGETVAVDADQAGSRIGDSLANGLFRDAQGRIRNASGQFASDAEKLAAGLDDAGTSADGAGQKLSGAGKKASDAGKDAGNSSSGWTSFAAGAKTAGTAMLAVSGISLAPALGAIPGLAAGAAAGLATLAGAFLGVGKAIKDNGAVQAGGGGISGAQQAATAFSNAVAVRNAGQAISDAETQAARSAVSSAEQIQSAKQGVGDAERNAATAAQSSADQITAAQQRVNQAAYAGVQAEQSYTNAVYNEQQANLALVNARQAAANQLVDSQNAAKDSHLSTEQAVLAERQAQQSLTAANGNSLLTADQKLAAQIALEQATQQVADAKQHEKEATESASVVTAAGVDNAPSVLAAQHALQLATEATANAQNGVQQAAQSAAAAQTGLARANQAAANQQVSSDEAVAKAQQQLADADRNAAQQRADAAKTVARAQQNLADTIKQQQLAAAASAVSGSAAVNQFAKDMKNLDPAGRDFVNTFDAMRGEFHGLSLDAQAATLPGFTQMLKDSNHLLPTVEVGVRNTGRAFSDTAASVGKLFANPEFDAAAMHFTQIVTGGFAQVMSGLPPLLNAIVTSGVQAAPLINAVALGIHDILASGLPAFLSGLNVNAAGAAQGVGALFGAVNGLLGPVGTLVGGLSGALGPALAIFEPEVIKAATAIETNLMPLMPQLSTDLVDVAQVLDQVLQILEPIIPLIATDLSTGLRVVDPLLKDTASFLQENQRWLTPVAEGILAAVVAVKAWNLATSAVSGVTGLATTAMSKLGLTAKATAAAETEASAAAGEAGFAGSLRKTIPVVGAVLIAGAALGTWLDHVTSGSQKAATSVDQYTTAMVNSKSAAALLGGDSKDLDAVLATVGAHANAAAEPIASVGIAMGKLSQMGIPGGDALKNYDGALAQLVTSGNATRAKQIVDQITAATDSHGKALINTAKDFPEYFAALDKQSATQATATQKTQDGTTALGNMGASLGSTADKFGYMTSAISQSQTLDQFHSQLLQLKDTLDQNGTSLDTTTTKGLANRDAFSQIAQQVENYGQQLHTAGDSDGLVATKMQDMVRQLEDQAGKFGYNKQQVDAYLKSIGLIPSSVETTLTTTIAVQINQALLQAAGKDIGHVVGHYLVPGQAAGGPVTGPGTGTSDSILRRLSNGEFIVPADATARIGPAGMEQIRNGQIPQVGGTTPQVGAQTINLNYFGSTLPTPEEQHVFMRDLTLAVRP